MSFSYSAWLGNVRMIAEAFADSEFQRDAWSGRLASSLSSPDEMMCVYFDDVLVPDFIAENRSDIGEGCAAVGAALTALLEQFPWPMDNGFISAELLLEMPQWSDVCKAAGAFLECLPADG
ncbi:MAG TPA: hypothetical protein VD865_07385 [Stenotrophomonas sp.]|nr:hypothetical protein [Stenotrophomonas sp.]